MARRYIETVTPIPPRWLVIAPSVMFSIFILAGCSAVQNAMYKEAIQKAIHEDSLTGHAATYDHTAAMRRVNLNDCPPDFREAYMSHIHAWEERAAVNAAQVKLEDDAGAAALGGILSSVFGTDDTPWADHERAAARLKELESSASGDVHTTWEDVERIAAKYGVVVQQ